MSSHNWPATTAGAGSGDVVGPASASNNAVARYDTTTGKLLQNSGVLIDDSDNITGVVALTATGEISTSDGMKSDTKLEAGDPGTESSGVNINGTTYAAKLRANDIGGTAPAQLVLHRHSTSLAAVALGARSNSADSTHAAVTNGQKLWRIIAGGHTGSHYDLFGELSFEADSSGTISGTSAPGKLVLKVTADSAQTPTEAMSITNDKTATFAGAVILNADPTASLGAATKQYVDAAINGVTVKEGVDVATTANITLSGEQTIDGVLTSGSRVLVKDQTSADENGIYVSAAGAWSRAADANSEAELNNALVTVGQGTAQANTGWYQTEEIATLETDNVTFVQFFGAGTYTADGSGIELSGSTFSLELDGSTLSKSASGLKVADGGISNTQVDASAAIDLSKLATTTASRALVSDGSGFVSAATTTAVEIGYVNGVTSAIQTQIDSKQADVVTTRGDVIRGSSGNAAERLALGTNGHGLQSDGTDLAYAPMQTVVHAVSSADYTVTDTDGYRTIAVTTGASDRTITLPTAADNDNRTIIVKKVDSGAGNVIVVDDAVDSALIDGAASHTLYSQYDSITVQCDGSTWHIIGHSTYLTAEGKRAQSAASGISSSTAGNATSVSLTPGKWMVFGHIGFTGSANLTSAFGWTSTTSATLPATDERADTVVIAIPDMDLSTQNHTVEVPMHIYDLSSTTTVYLGNQASFSSGTASVYGTIKAVRIAL